MNELTNPEAMGFLERAVRDPSIDVVKLEQIIALQERVLDREAKRQFAAAMNALQAEMTPISRDRTNPHAHSRYATYEAIDAILRPLYTRHGFSVRFTTHAAQNRIRVGCTVSHVGGHSEQEHELESGPDTAGARGQANKTEVQGVGSIVSYLKRYTLMAAFAVALQDDETDDDGESLRRRDAINRDVPMPEPAGNGRDPWDLWLETLDGEAAKLVPGDTEGWAKFWDRNAVKRAFSGLQGGQLARLEAIQQRHRERLWPTPPAEGAG